MPKLMSLQVNKKTNFVFIILIRETNDGALPIFCLTFSPFSRWPTVLYHSKLPKNDIVWAVHTFSLSFHWGEERGETKWWMHLSIFFKSLLVSYTSMFWNTGIYQYISHRPVPVHTGIWPIWLVYHLLNNYH